MSEYAGHFLQTPDYTVGRTNEVRPRPLSRPPSLSPSLPPSNRRTPVRAT
jgi:hypothetical protein